MSSIIIILLITYIVPVILNLITKRASKNTRGTTNDFVMMPPKDLAIIGAVGTFFFLSLTILTIYIGQMRGFNIFASIALLSLGILLMLAPVKGFWETRVKGDDIIASRFWILQESAKISNIDHCRQGKGGIHVFEKGKTSKTLTIDNVCTNINLFEDRMDQEGVKILPYAGKEKHQE